MSATGMFSFAVFSYSPIGLFDLKWNEIPNNNQLLLRPSLITIWFFLSLFSSFIDIWVITEMGYDDLISQIELLANVSFYWNVSYFTFCWQWSYNYIGYSYTFHFLQCFWTTINSTDLSKKWVPNYSTFRRCGWIITSITILQINPTTVPITTIIKNYHPNNTLRPITTFDCYHDNKYNMYHLVGI
jgi:hypothetical protein